MNQLIYFHSNRKGKKVKEAIMNEAFDTGFFPMKDHYHYGLIDFNIERREMKTYTFGNDREAMTECLSKNKSEDLILFNFFPSTEEDYEPITTISTPNFTDKYLLLGNVILNDPEYLRETMGALGMEIKKEAVGDQMKEIFLSDFALLDHKNTKKYLSKGRFDFLIIKYDLWQQGSLAKPDYLYLGSNNNYLQIKNNTKFLSASIMYPSEKGRKERSGGKLIGGNVIKYSFIRNDGFEIESPLYLPHHTFSQENSTFVKPQDLNLRYKLDYDKLKFWNKDKQEAESLPNDIPVQRAYGFHMRNSSPLTATVENNVTTYRYKNKQPTGKRKTKQLIIFKRSEVSTINA